MKIIFVYHRYFDGLGNTRLVGGVETYLEQLATRFTKEGWDPLLVQGSKQPFKRREPNLTVVGVNISGLSHRRQKVVLFEAAHSYMNPSTDVLIFGADHCSVRDPGVCAISIQHGIFWDVPFADLERRLLTQSRLGCVIASEYAKWNAIRYFENVDSRVCVDYNFLNWYKTVRRGVVRGNTWVIPNATHVGAMSEIEAKLKNQNEIVTLIYARRFERYRGTRLLGESLGEVLQWFPNLHVTIAGEGPDQDWLKDKIGGNQRVTFMKYLPNEAHDIHLRYDIALIPSLGSEGTSLSVAEAMAAGCAVVATAVGGVTNMIIDGFNGVLVMPDKRSVSEGLRRVVSDKGLRCELARRAHETAENAFSRDRWGDRWVQVVRAVRGTQDESAGRQSSGMAW